MHNIGVRLYDYSLLGLESNIVNRHPFPGPGLAIRVICQDEAYIDDDFKSTNMILNAVVNYAGVTAGKVISNDFCFA